MPPSSTLSAADLAFKNLFARRPPAASDDRHWLLVGIEYPPPERAAGNEADPAKLPKQLASANQWIDFAIAPPMRPSHSVTWFALRDNPLGSDALFTGWITADRHVQIAVTKYDLHVRTQLGPVEDTTDDKLFARALRVGDNTFTCGGGDPSCYPLTRIGDFLCGRSVLTGVAGWEALTFATDGVGVKFSALKLADQSSIKSPSTGPLDDKPWFGPKT